MIHALQMAKLRPLGIWQTPKLLITSNAMDDSGAQQADEAREAAKHTGPPVWLYNAVWAAFGAAIALAVLRFCSIGRPVDVTASDTRQPEYSAAYYAPPQS